MRILFLDNNLLWMYGLPYAFQELGYIIKVSGPIIDIQTIITNIDSFVPNLVITMSQTFENIEINTQKWIGDLLKSKKIPHVIWDNSQKNFADFTWPLIKNLRPDFVFTISQKNAELIIENQIKSTILAFGYDSKLHQPSTPNPNFQHSVAVVDDCPTYAFDTPSDYFRVLSFKTLISPLLKARIDLDFYGNGWREAGQRCGFDIPEEYLHKSLSYRLTPKVYSAARIVIALQDSPHYLTQQAYEILGCGGLLLTIDFPALKKLGIPGRDFLSSSSPLETTEIVKYFLAHIDEQKQIRACGQLAVALNHYLYRAEFLLMTLHDQGILTTTQTSSINLGYKKTTVLKPNPKLSNFKLHPEGLKIIAPQAKSEVLIELCNILNDLFPRYDIRSAEHISAFVAQAAHETMGFTLFSEMGLKEALTKNSLNYFNRYEYNTEQGKSLGNTEPGDGYRYRGRGLFQITGRWNYHYYTQVIQSEYPNVNLEVDPDLLSKDIRLSCLVACEFWKFNELSKFGIVTISYIINGDITHLEKRIELYKIFLDWINRQTN